MCLLTRGYVGVFAVLLILVNCSSDSDRKFKQQNRERFSDRETSREAIFLVNAIDESSTILGLAELAEKKLNDPASKSKIRQIMQTQTEVSVKLRSFAEGNDMAVPLSAPERNKARISALTEKSGSEFLNEWNLEMKLHHQQLLNDLSKYRSKSSIALRSVLDSTIMLMNENTTRILALNELEE